jgi:hypothetical protein
MLKVMAVLRTLFLLFMVGFTVRALPMFGQIPNTLDEQYSRCASSFSLVQRAAWYAIAWILLDAAIGWWIAVRRGKADRASKSQNPPAVQG